MKAILSRSKTMVLAAALWIPHACAHPQLAILVDEPNSTQRTAIDTTKSASIFLNSKCPEELAAKVDFQSWSQLLASYVKEDGSVRYRAWSSDVDDRRRLIDLLNSIASQDESQLESPSEKISFWLNTYNIAAMEIKLREYIELNSLPEDIWNNTFLHVGNATYSLNQIEHEKLRPLKNPLIHFGLHCGARSCPKISPSIWTAKDLDQDLELATRTFLSQPNSIRWNPDRRRLALSKIFEWYQVDFGPDHQALVQFILPYVTDDIRSEIEAIGCSNVSIEFLEYDWSAPAADDDHDPSVQSTVLVKQDKIYSDEFPSEVEYWKDQDTQYELGLVEANQLRQKLLAVDSQSSIPSSAENRLVPGRHIENIVLAIRSFQEQTRLQDKQIVSVENFQSTAESIRRQLSGGSEINDPLSAFNAFDGKWYGLWDIHPVNHDWRPSRHYTPPRPSPSGLKVIAEQYAWIHNGFGWNYLVQDSGDASLPFVLGQVYYLQDQNLKNIAARKPHVGVLEKVLENETSCQRIIWITEQEIFLEEVFPQKNVQETYYVITGIYHSLLGDQPEVSSEAVQAKYTRHSNPRPPFIKVQWSPPKR